MRLLAGILFLSTVAGAQTVSVGSASSSTSGTTTTVTIPVTVATPAVTTTGTPTTSNLALLDVTAGTGDGVSTVQTLQGAFSTVSLPTVVTDTASAWNPKTFAFVAPSAGTYLVMSRVRLVDGTAVGTSFGQGVSNQTVDGPYFLWSTATGLRNESVNYRLVQLTKGESITLFTYADGNGAKLNSAELMIEQVR